MFSGASLAVIPISYNDPWNPFLLIVSGRCRNGVVLTCSEVLDLVSFSISSINGTDQHVVGDVVQVSTVFEPRPGHGNVVGGCLALGLYENGQIHGIFAIPCWKGFQNLETITGRRHLDGDSVARFRWCLVCILTGIISPSGQASTRWRG